LAREGDVKERVLRWAPAVLLGLGVVITTAGVHTQHAVPLRSPLEEEVPRQLAGWSARDIEISAAEQRVAGMDEYLMRVYEPSANEAAAGALPWFNVYVGYYQSQAQGNTIHSPKNCLPGGGWEPLTSARQPIVTPLGRVTVNRYLIANGAAQSLVLYWYQGRGRIEANEYRVKWDLLRDQALHGRSDEALVRVIVPVTTTEADAYAQAAAVARELVVHVDRALPARS
jgi:EpsI family protein